MAEVGCSPTWLDLFASDQGACAQKSDESAVHLIFI